MFNNHQTIQILPEQFCPSVLLHVEEMHWQQVNAVSL